MSTFKNENGKRYKLVFTPYIRKNGKTIYPKRAKFFKFWVEVDDAA